MLCEINFVLENLVKISFDKLHDNTKGWQRLKVRGISSKVCLIFIALWVFATVVLRRVSIGTFKGVWGVSWVLCWLTVRTDDVDEFRNKLRRSFKLFTDLIKSPHELDLANKLNGIVLCVCLVLHYLKGNNTTSGLALSLGHATIAAFPQHFYNFILAADGDSQCFCRAKLIFFGWVLDYIFYFPKRANHRGTSQEVRRDIFEGIGLHWCKLTLLVGHYWWNLLLVDQILGLFIVWCLNFNELRRLNRVSICSGIWGSIMALSFWVHLSYIPCHWWKSFLLLLEWFIQPLVFHVYYRILVNRWESLWGRCIFWGWLLSSKDCCTSNRGALFWIWSLYLAITDHYCFLCSIGRTHEILFIDG